MPDNLYLNLWYSDSELVETFAHAAAVMQQLPFSPQQPGIIGVAVHPISWGEATILEEHFRPGISPEEAVTIAAGLPHEDYAYVFEASWDLWSPITPQAEWTLRPSLVRFIVRGDEFEDFRHVTLDLLQAFAVRRLEAIEHIVARLTANTGLNRAESQFLFELTLHRDLNNGFDERNLQSKSRICRSNVPPESQDQPDFLGLNLIKASPEQSCQYQSADYGQDHSC